MSDRPERRQPAISDYSQSSYTAIISDLHLCEEEPINLKFPLWKKYKTSQFFFDDEFELFLEKLNVQSNGEKIELILNGDSCTSLPSNPPFYMTWLERRRGLYPQEEKSVYKMKVILSAHKIFAKALRNFIVKGNRVVFVIGNHDLELHFPEVQEELLKALDLPIENLNQVRFNEWFYISNGDTHIEHGNQYDPYCMAQDPINPYIRKFNKIEIRVPFGNLATKYLINGMGFFNPHLDSNYIMTPKEYVVFFLKYIVRAQPFLLFIWLWGSIVTLFQSFLDRLRPNITDPMTIEDRVEYIARKSNATPRMVRELKELFVAPAASYPSIIMRELWLDRAFLIFSALIVLYVFFLQIDKIFNIPIWWAFIPFFLFMPFFLFYSRSVRSEVHEYKEPREHILNLIGMITKVSRVVYGHTHIVQHEMIGAIEHLNSGTWSPAFSDVECEKPISQKTFVWIYPGPEGVREAKVCQIRKGEISEVFGSIDRRREKREKINFNKKIDA
ncbi:MAG: hypothetical protein ABL927_03600 [Bdellovibrionales bacterium]